MYADSAYETETDYRTVASYVTQLQESSIGGLNTSLERLTFVDELPHPREFGMLQYLYLQKPSLGKTIKEKDLASVIYHAEQLEGVVLSGVSRITTDRIVVTLARRCMQLHTLDLTGCNQVTDVGILELATKSLPLRSIKLNGVTGLTDPSISALAKTCSKLVELELADLPLLSPISVRDIWSYSRKLRTLRLARCPLMTDKAFPSALSLASFNIPDYEQGLDKPLPHRPTTWLDELPPLILQHKTENLRALDLSFCNVTDNAIEGIVAHAPKIQCLNLTGCGLLTDRGVESLSNLGDHLDVLLLAHVTNVTDNAIVKLARACTNLRSVDLAFCRRLTDMTVQELAGLSGLRRLHLVRVPKLTDIAVYALAEYGRDLERLSLSYCDKISLEALHLMLSKLPGLEYLAANGLPALRREGIQRFSDTPPSTFRSAGQRSAYRVFSGEGVKRLREFLNKEKRRSIEAEARNIPFLPRADDKLWLY